MQTLVKQTAAIVAMSAIVTQGSWAGEYHEAHASESAIHGDLMSSAFERTPSADVKTLDDQAMSETQGELWPWILGVAAFDLSLAGFYWGTYVPITAPAGGACVNCDVGNKSR